jgi:hypothetical protein
MREDVFGTFAQMKHSLIRRSCLKQCVHARKMSSRTHFVNNYFRTLSAEEVFTKKKCSCIRSVKIALPRAPVPVSLLDLVVSTFCSKPLVPHHVLFHPLASSPRSVGSRLRNRNCTILCKYPIINVPRARANFHNSINYTIQRLLRGAPH